MRRISLLLGLLCGMLPLSWAGEPGSSRLLPSTASYVEQLSAVKGGRYDSAQLVEFLKNPEAVTGLYPHEERSVLNEVMNALRKAEAPDSGLEELLMSLAMDPDRDPGVREYAVQHLFLWHAKTVRKTKVEDYLWRCTEDPVVSSAAILQLHHFGSKSGDTLSKPLAPVVLRAMARTDLRNADRITLLLVAAECGIPDALPFARQWAEAATDRVVLQAALTAIGKLGDSRELEFLDRLEMQKNLDDIRKTVDSTRTYLAAKMANGVTQ